MLVRDFKNTKKVVTIKFDIETETELKRLKAFAILHGFYNPFRKEMKPANSIIEYVDDYRHNRTILEDSIDKIASQLI